MSQLFYKNQYSQMMGQLEKKLESMANFCEWSGEQGDPEDFLIFDETNIFEQSFLQSLEGFKGVTILLSERADAWNVENILCRLPIQHLVGINHNRELFEIKSIIDKTQNHDFWGLDNYIREGATKQDYQIQSSSEISNVIEESVNSFDYHLYFNSPKNYLKLMANELLTNAFYNARTDSAGVSLHAHQERSIPVILDSGHKVGFAMAEGDNYLALAVKDPFGSLTRDIFIQNLKRSFEKKETQNKPGGAGLGLYLVYNFSNQVILNLAHGKATEIISLIDKNKRLKKYKKRVTSFHCFEDKT